MIAKDLIKKIRDNRAGYVMIEVQNFNDVFYVQGVKSSLIDTIKNRFESDEETGFEIDDDGYFGKDFDAA